MAGSEKKAADEGRTLVFVDESGFYLLPLAGRTYAPVGQTPILRVPLRHEHLSVIGAITAQGRLFFQVHQHSCRAEEVVRLLRLLLRKIPGKLLVIWDGSPIHRGQAIKQVLARGAAKRLHLERLPGYAPDLNPQEGVWSLLKRNELANICCADLAELASDVTRAKERLRHRCEVILACFSPAACPLELPVTRSLRAPS